MTITTATGSHIGNEIDSCYCIDRDRFVVSLILTYSDQGDQIVSPEQAAAAALAHTRNGEPMWFVYDRLKQTRHFIAQEDIEALAEEMG